MKEQERDQATKKTSVIKVGGPNEIPLGDERILIIRSDE